jgi:hypothetical protein
MYTVLASYNRVASRIIAQKLPDLIGVDRSSVITNAI